MSVRLATAADAGEVARLLYAFNTEYGDPTPEPPALAERLAPMLEAGEVTVVLGGAGPDGLALLRFRPAFWSAGLDAYLEELYVAPPERGRGLGRELLEGAIEIARERGATRMDLNTSEDDRAARALYESAGFTDREGMPDGPLMFYYEREI